MVSDRQGRATDANENLRSSWFAGNRVTVDETSCVISEDEIDKQPHGSNGTCKLSCPLTISIFLGDEFFFP